MLSTLQKELFFEKAKLYYENLWAPSSFDRFNFFLKSLEHVILDKDFEKSEIKVIMCKGLINAHLEQICQKRVYYDPNDQKWKWQKSKVPCRWAKYEVVLTALSVAYKDFDLGQVGIEMKRLGEKDKFFAVAYELLDKSFKKMRSDANQTLIELGTRLGLRLEDERTGQVNFMGQFVKKPGLKTEVENYMKVRDNTIYSYHFN